MYLGGVGRSKTNNGKLGGITMASLGGWGLKLGNLEEIYFLNVPQVISLKKMVILSVKFTILVSRSPICTPLILLSALMRLAITSSAILYNRMDNRHPWRTHIGVEGSDRRPFILILDLILVYAT